MLKFEKKKNKKFKWWFKKYSFGGELFKFIWYKLGYVNIWYWLRVDMECNKDVYVLIFLYFIIEIIIINFIGK